MGDSLCELSDVVVKMIIAEKKYCLGYADFCCVLKEHIYTQANYLQDENKRRRTDPESLEETKRVILKRRRHLFFYVLTHY